MESPDAAEEAVDRLDECECVEAPKPTLSATVDADDGEGGAPTLSPPTPRLASPRALCPVSTVAAPPLGVLPLDRAVIELRKALNPEGTPAPPRRPESADGPEAPPRATLLGTPYARSTALLLAPLPLPNSCSRRDGLRRVLPVPRLGAAGDPAAPPGEDTWADAPFTRGGTDAAPEADAGEPPVELGVVEPRPAVTGLAMGDADAGPGGVLAPPDTVMLALLPEEGVARESPPRRRLLSSPCPRDAEGCTGVVGSLHRRERGK